MAIITSRNANYRNIHKKYTVGGGGAGSAKADTLAEAKRAWESIAKREAWRGKWNVAYIAISVRKQDTSGSMFYGKPLLTMFVPVRGSGMTADRILDMMKRREGTAPFKWIKGR